ncbi:MAG TPA: dynamin family protein [Trueperaceae bacterium]|nr:dynamin family protein [Trueperaceae bacterium]
MLDVPESFRELVAREREAITDLQVLLARLGADPEHLGDVRTALADLDGLFMIVVAGEFNAGKSSLLNALLGETVMPEGVTPTTDRITVVTHGERVTEREEGPAVVYRSHPAPLLQDIALVDTPGTNAIIKRHQELTERFVPRADLLLFVTSSDRPFTESERRFLELIASWGRKVIMVVNKVDILDTDDQRAEVQRYVRDNARDTLGVTPEVFLVSAKRAERARQEGDEQALEASGVPALSRAIAERLGAERPRLKLLSPLGVAQRLVSLHQDQLAARLALLTDDSASLEEIERQRQQFDRDMRREFEGYVLRVKQVVREVKERGDDFLDDVVRFRRIPKLLNSKAVQEEFEQRVVAGTEAELERAVSDLVDWFIERNLRFWEDVMRFVNERASAAEDRVIGEVGGRFEYDRRALVRSLGERAQDALDTYDDTAEARRLADDLQQAVLRTGLFNVTGIGLSAAVLAFISTVALDVTGVLLGLTLVGVGLFVIPRQRAKAKKELAARLKELEDALVAGLGHQFDEELKRSQEKLSGAISPYTRFVRAELDRLRDIGQELDEMSVRLAALRGEVEALE